MLETRTITLGILIILVFAWRFVRTRQLYLTSLHVRTLGLDPIEFNPRQIRSIIHQGLLGQRSIEPNSFFIRGIVLAIVALCLLPLKDYEPPLVALVLMLIALYTPWCVAHGIMLKKRQSRGEAS